MSSTRLKAGAMALIPKNHRITHAHVRCTIPTHTQPQNLQSPPQPGSTELVKREELPTFLGTPNNPNHTKPLQRSWILS
jgi:hypothetical protein